MKFRKIVSAVLASVVAAGMCAANVFAVEDGEATFCFDTEIKSETFQSYGSVEQAGMKLTHTTFESKNGNGCIIVSEDCSGDIQQQYGGYFIDASCFGAEDFTSFENCTIEMSVKLCEGAEAFCENLSLYSDGTIWLTQPATGLSTEEWSTVSITIPDGANNTTVGFTIPTFKTYTGNIVYIDDLTITKPDGTIMENIGDYQLKKMVAEDTVSTGKNIGMTILLVVLILAIVGGIGLIVSSALRKFS
ncbi:MAG: hypothetical protein J6K17_11305 [Oscillospiraceae bacterium]|nr:hypothetical protein [Oscillospiraceae bacterium]